MNKNLPELSIWQARSTYAVLTAVVFSVLNALGITLPEELDPEQVTDLIFAGIPVAGVLWAAWERRAPNYRLVVRKSHGPH